MLLYECAALGTAVVTSGRSRTVGVRSAGGIHRNYSTALEAKFAAEIIKSCAGMKRDAANEIVKALLPKYEEQLKNPPLGKSFLECYDIKTLTPTKEWRDIYHRIQKELIDLGYPLE
jgi:methylamine--corrinoid protein Co-methyltransferase